MPVQLTANAEELSVTSAAISPDGKYLAYADPRGLFLRLMATGETHPVDLPEGFLVEEVDWFPSAARLLVSSPSASGDRISLWTISILGG